MLSIITGKVIRGDGYGRKIGFPTANLDVGSPKLPSAGVYGGKAIINRHTYRAGIIINDAGKVEAYLFGYRGDAYEKEMTLKLRNFIREFKKFDTEAELITQIKKDLKQC
ncbi:MAG: riboflavin kinase [Candidatus Pacebacteria bacterium]|nr:riboflavin kinase [Candidatus Paceibacterota bacterium]